MLKIVLTYERAVLHTLLVYDIAPKRELPDDIGAPLVELCGTDRVDSITHRNDCIKVVEQRVASHLSRTFLLNYRVFSVVASLFNFLFLNNDTKPVLLSEFTFILTNGRCLASG